MCRAFFRKGKSAPLDDRQGFGLQAAWVFLRVAFGEGRTKAGKTREHLEIAPPDDTGLNSKSMPFVRRMEVST